jgi:hypothetical protein
VNQPEPPGAGPADESSLRHIAYFVTAHGFGYPTRACAVMAAAHARQPDLCFDIFTAAPECIFRDSLTGPFVYHHAITDVGLAQRRALVEDLEATLERLDEFLLFDPFLVRTWADWLERLQCELVVCDMAPLGLAVAEAAGLALTSYDDRMARFCWIVGSPAIRRRMATAIWRMRCSRLGVSAACSRVACAIFSSA